MTQFNLEKALQGEKVVTRDGREVKRLKYIEDKLDPLPLNYPLQGIVGIMRVVYWSRIGTYMPNVKHKYDLFMAE